MNKKEQKTREQLAEKLFDIWDAKLFKTLSEPIRIQILQYIITNGCSDIAAIASHFPQDRSVISRHLNLMYEAGILICEKKSRHMLYDIDCQKFLGKMESITDCIKKCVQHCSSSKVCSLFK